MFATNFEGSHTAASMVKTTTWSSTRPVPESRCVTGARFLESKPWRKSGMVYK